MQRVSSHSEKASLKLKSDSFLLASQALSTVLKTSQLNLTSHSQRACPHCSSKPLPYTRGILLPLRWHGNLRDIPLPPLVHSSAWENVWCEVPLSPRAHTCGNINTNKHFYQKPHSQDLAMRGGARQIRLGEGDSGQHCSPWSTKQGQAGAASVFIYVGTAGLQPCPLLPQDKLGMER